MPRWLDCGLTLLGVVAILVTILYLYLLDKMNDK